MRLGDYLPFMNKPGDKDRTACQKSTRLIKRYGRMVAGWEKEMTDLEKDGKRILSGDDPEAAKSYATDYLSLGANIKQYKGKIQKLKRVKRVSKKRYESLSGPKGERGIDIEKELDVYMNNVVGENTNTGSEYLDESIRRYDEKVEEDMEEEEEELHEGEEEMEEPEVIGKGKEEEGEEEAEE